MKSSSIGSPFLSYIQNRNRSPFIPVESMSITTPLEMLVLKEFAPRLFLALSKQAYVSKVTVVIYHSVETWAGFVAKTTCSIVDGKRPLENVIEYSYLEAYQLLMPEKLRMQLVSRGHHRREYLVSTSPPTLRRVQNHKQDTSFDGLQLGLFPG